MDVTEARPDWSGAEPSSPRGHPYLSFGLRAAFGLAVIAFLMRRYGGSTIFSLVARERLAYFVAAIAAYLAGLTMSAWRWQLLAASLKILAPFREFLAYYLVGAFTNLFVPGLVGGDAARTLYLARRHSRLGAAAATVIADRGVGLLALFWFAAAAAWLLNRATLPPAVIRPTILIGILALAAYLAAPFVARTEKLMPRRLARYAALVTPYLRQPVSLVPAIILSLLLQASLVISQYLLALGLGLAIPFSLFVLCVPVANVFAALPLTLNGLGVREGAYAVLFGMAGVGRADAVALGLLWFVSTMLGGLVGIVPFLTTETPTLRQAKAASDPS